MPATVYPSAARGRTALSAALLVVVAVALFPAVAPAGQSGRASGTPGTDNVPLYVNYQGYLTDTAGTPVTATLPLTIAVFADSSGGTALLTRSLSAVAIEQGVFSVKLSLNPSDTAVFVSGQRRWIQLTVDGRLMEPRTEMTTMPFGVHALHGDYSDNAGYAADADRLDGRQATDFIWNGTTSQSPASFWIAGSGRADQQLIALATGLTSQPAIVGDVQGTCTGVYGYSEDGLGVYAGSDNGTAVYAEGQNDGAFGVWGANSDGQGTGVAGSGANDTMFYLEGGSGGAFSSRHHGLFAYAHDTTGTGIATMGNRISDTVFTLAQGSGGAFNGTTVGVYGLARNLTGDRCGGYFKTCGAPGGDSTWAYVAYNYGGQKYKVLGDGNVSTVMPTQDGSKILFAPESPEALFEDYGSSRLAGGHCRVDLDVRFLDCVAVGQDNPLRVFITLNDNCRGIYVKSDASGFDAYEVGGGTSNAAFTYRVVGTRRGAAGVRFPAAPPAPTSLATPVNIGRVPPTPVR